MSENNNGNDKDREKELTDELNSLMSDTDVLAQIASDEQAAREALADAYPDGVTIEVAGEDLLDLAFGAMTAEVTAFELGEDATEDLFEHMRRLALDHIGDADSEEAARLATMKMRAWMEFHQRERSGSLGGATMAAGLTPDDVPDAVAEWLDENASAGGMGTVNLADDDLPDEVREFFEDYVEEHVAGAESNDAPDDRGVY